MTSCPVWLPGQTQCNKTHFYQTFDVTNHLENGANVMGAMLSEGWWSGLLRVLEGSIIPSEKQIKKIYTNAFLWVS